MPLGAAKFAYQGYSVAAGPVEITRPQTITAVNDAQVDTAISKFGGASAAFDGTGDYVYITGGDGTGDFSGDFTFECWFYSNNVSNNAKIFDGRGINAAHTGGDTVFSLADTLLIDHNGGAARVFIDGADRASGASISNSTWYHLAVQRSGGTFNAWLNGTRIVDYAGSDDYTSVFEANQAIGIGASTGALSQGWNGNIDELRISAVARYTNGASITVPTAAFVNDSDTYLLLHCDGTDGSTTFTDDDGVRASVGVSSYGDAQVDTAQSKFGGASALFDGTGDGLLANNDLDLSSGEWTMETWIYPTNINTTEIIFDPRFGAQPSRVPSWRNGGIAYFNGSWQVSTNRFTANNWYHFAWVYDGSDVKCYVDGTLELTVSEAATFIDSKLAIGARYDIGAVYYVGHLDEIRISNTARYTSNFTAPTAAFTNDADTVLLIHCDGADASTTFTDDNG